jgi:hypothetical protein
MASDDTSTVVFPRSTWKAFRQTVHNDRAWAFQLFAIGRSAAGGTPIDCRRNPIIGGASYRLIEEIKYAALNESASRKIRCDVNPVDIVIRRKPSEGAVSHDAGVGLSREGHIARS